MKIVLDRNYILKSTIKPFHYNTVKLSLHPRKKNVS